MKLHVVMVSGLPRSFAIAKKHRVTSKRSENVSFARVTANPYKARAEDCLNPKVRGFAYTFLIRGEFTQAKTTEVQHLRSSPLQATGSHSSCCESSAKRSSGITDL